MVWASHRAVTFVTIYAVTSDISAALCGTMGSTFPDKIEGPLWRKWHRTYSHWFVSYLPVLLLFMPSTEWYPVEAALSHNVFMGIKCAVFWFFVGAVAHIAEDAVCGKIPIVSPRKRVTVFPRLFYVGSKKETVFTLVYCIIVLFVRGYFT